MEKKKFNIIRYTIILIVIALIICSTVYIGSITQPISLKETQNTLTYFYKQLKSIGIGLFASVIVYIFYTSNRVREWFMKNYKLVTLLLLVCMMIFLFSPFSPLGVRIKGARRWINVGFQLQPSEAVKPILIYTVANILHFGEDTKEIITLLLITIVAVAFPIFLQKSNTSMIQILLIIILMALNSEKIKESTKWWVSVIAIGSVSLLFSFMYYFSDVSYVIRRIDNFINNTSVQAKASVTAIKLGGLNGTGISRGTQKYFFLPEAHNDYIFASISEESGFLMSLTIVLLFTLLIILMLYLTFYMKGINKYISYGIIYNITNQFIINILIALNLVPSTGISLPFIGYGGTSMLTNLTCMSLFLACVKIEMGDENI